MKSPNSLKNLKANNGKEIISYIEEYLEITGKLSELNIKLNNSILQINRIYYNYIVYIAYDTNNIELKIL